MNDKTKYSIFLSVAIIYFFCNNTFLPNGLLYTAMLTPFFLYWLFVTDKIVELIKWGVLLLIPIPFHFLVGVDIKTYFISSGLVFTVWVFLFTAIYAVKMMNTNLDRVFKVILLINFVLVVLVWILSLFNLGNSFFWHDRIMTTGINYVPRLMLFNYEPTLYALALSPVFVFYLLKVLTNKIESAWFYFLAVGLPLALSLSFGVIGGLAISFIISYAIFYKYLPGITKRYFFVGFVSIVLTIIVFLFVAPENAVFIRIANIFQGIDGSASARLDFSYDIAIKIIKYFKAWFGIGPGQVKIVFDEIILNVLNRPIPDEYDYRIPNSMAEMLATYGVYGFIVKIAVEVFFFIKLKIYRNIYAFTLFLFIFIYQFTCSFIVNVMEIGTWVIVFQSRFIDFEIDNIKGKSI